MRVESYRATRQEMGARIMAEAQAKRYIVDTIETHYSAAEASKRQQDAGAVLLSYSGQISRQREREKSQRPGLLGDRSRIAHRSFLQQECDPGEARAEKLRSLLRPELKDKIAFAGSDTGVTVVGAMLKFKGEEYVKKLKALSPAVHNVSGRALLDMVISGEVGVSPSTFRNHVEVSLKLGAPIEWIPLDVVPANSGSTAVRSTRRTRTPHCSWPILFSAREARKFWNSSNTAIRPKNTASNAGIRSKGSRRNRSTSSKKDGARLCAI